MRVSPWGRVVAISALLVVGAAAALAAGALASAHERQVSYPVIGPLNGLAFDLGAGDIVIAGGGRSVIVSRPERYAFGHDARTTRTVSGGVLRVRSRCPTSLLGRCSVRYRVVVPDNVPVDVRTSGGSVTLSGYRGTARGVTSAGGGVPGGDARDTAGVPPGAGGNSVAGYGESALGLRAGRAAVDAGATGPP